MPDIRRLMVIAVFVAGCGGGAQASGSASGAASSTTPAPPGEVSTKCATALADFTDALTEIDSRLNVGLTYPNYGERLADARVAYDKIKFKDLDGDCINGAGKPLEDAMNEYINAYASWKVCIDKSGCDTDSIAPQLQVHWTKATGLIAGVKKLLP